jgi:sugar/nucleoside kinase (ribokinase family)
LFVIKYLAFGIIIDDIVFPQGYTRMGVLGGGGPQTAWGMAASLGSGESVGLVAGVGTDLESSILEPLRAARINLDGLRVTDLPTPRAWQTIEFSGRRSQVWRVPVNTLGSQLTRHERVFPTSYRDARGLHWGIHASEFDPTYAHSLTERGYRISLEPFRPTDEPMTESALRKLLAACEIFSPNMLEASTMVGSDDPDQIRRVFRAMGCRILALRKGELGAEVWNLPEGRGVAVSAIDTTVMDAVGAGNAFCGALITRLDEGIDEAACHASVAASYMVEQVGVPAALPDPADYARRMEQVRAGLTVLEFRV